MKESEERSNILLNLFVSAIDCQPSVEPLVEWIRSLDFVRVQEHDVFIGEIVFFDELLDGGT